MSVGLVFSTLEVTRWLLGQQYRRFTAAGYPCVPQWRRGGYLSPSGKLEHDAVSPCFGNLGVTDSAAR